MVGDDNQIVNFYVCMLITGLKVKSTDFNRND